MAAKKKYFLIIDTETTQTEKVADLGIVVCDKEGNIVYEVGLMVGEWFCDRDAHPLFHVFGDANDVFSAASLPRRYADYDQMIADGRRMVASVNGINKLLTKIRLQYDPVLTAYNIAFDAGKCANSGIDLTIFDKRFCLWHAAAEKWGSTKKYRQFILDGWHFGNKTARGHVGIQTKADTMAKFLLGADLPDEPHTALEDARDYERPILAALVKNTPPKVYMNPKPYSWRDYAAKGAFVAV
jgi:hypothetical protein